MRKSNMTETLRNKTKHVEFIGHQFAIPSIKKDDIQTESLVKSQDFATVFLITDAGLGQQYYKPKINNI
jgi:hypothetical protein